MMQNAPLLVFASFAARDRFCRCLGLIDSGHEPRLIEESYVEQYMTSDQRQKPLNVSVVRTPLGMRGFVDKMTRLAQSFTGPVFVFNACLARQARQGPNVAINPPVQEYVNVLGLPLNDAQRSFLATFEAVQPTMRPLLARPSPPGFSDLDTIFAPFTGDSSEDIEHAIRLSLQDQERQSQERAKVVVALPKDWDSVLKPASEPAEPGLPVCIVCRVSKASVCFVPCGHQVCCDECVRTMKTRTDLVKTCPVCRAPVDTIVRPTLSELAPMHSTPTKPVAKKRRVTKKT